MTLTFIWIYVYVTVTVLSPEPIITDPDPHVESQELRIRILRFNTERFSLMARMQDGKWYHSIRLEKMYGRWYINFIFMRHHHESSIKPVSQHVFILILLSMSPYKQFLYQACSLQFQRECLIRCNVSPHVIFTVKADLPLNSTFKVWKVVNVCLFVYLMTQMGRNLQFHWLFNNFVFFMMNFLTFDSLLKLFSFLWVIKYCST